MKYVEIKNRKISIKEKEIRKLKKGEILIKMKYAGLCGSDLHRINNKDFVQHNILGHEIVGEIVKSQNLCDIGKIVAVNPIIVCGKCDYCKHVNSQFCTGIHSLGKDLDGGFAEFLIAPRKNICFFDNNFETKLGVLIDGEAVVIHALNLLKNHINKGDCLKIAIIGSGSIALLVAITLKILSKHEITIFCKKEKESYFASQGFNCIDFFNQKTSVNEYFDIIIECVGGSQSDTINFAINSAKKQGIIIGLGVFKEDYLLNLNIRNILSKEVTLLGSNSFSCTEKNNDFLNGYNIIKENQNTFMKVLGNSYNLEDFNEGVSNKNNYLKTFFYFN